MSFLDLPLSSHIVDNTARPMPAKSEPMMKPIKQALHFGEQMLPEKRLEKEAIMEINIIFMV